MACGAGDVVTKKGKHGSAGGLELETPKGTIGQIGDRPPAPATARVDELGRLVVIIATQRDGTKRVFRWGPDASAWKLLSDLVDHNIRKSDDAGDRLDIVQIQGGILE
jgi:hypothetical protein